RADVLATWLSYYNNRRPHSALAHKTPASRIEPTD
ncbi:MAG: Integrase core domain, partial [Acidimicrobiales bacterium]|nr:Integrase core domain [Acidimicrobiales bacterium]